MAENTVKRLFVAIHANQGLQEDISNAIKKLRQSADHKNFDIRWTKPENLHITLLFLGEVPETEIPHIIEKLNFVASKAASFQLKIEGVSAFPDIYAGRVIYLDVQRSQKILDLVTFVETALSKTQSENYIPHMTIGRLRNPKSVKDLISPFVRKKFGKIDVSEMVLYESIQAGAFPIYKPIQKFELKSKASCLEILPQSI